MYSTLFITALLALVSGCGSGPAGLEIKDPYVTATSNDVAALYFTVDNHEAEDTLISVSTDVTANAMFHQDVVTGASERMQALDSITIPAHGKFVFRPGVFHVMLMDVKQPLSSGTTVLVTARFKNAGLKTFIAPVRALGTEPGSAQ